MQKIFHKVALTVLTGGLLLATSCSELADRLTGAAIGAGGALIQSFFITTEDEIKMGEEVRTQVFSEYPEYTDNPELVDYVREIGSKLAAHAERKEEVDFTFYIVNSTEVNAFAIPGGSIFVTTEALKYFRNEAELAAVLGHEIGHVDKKHSIEGMKQAMIAQGLVEGALSDADAELLKQIANMTLDLVLKGSGREQEKESDRVGTRLASKLGYEETAMTGFLKTILELSGGDPSGIFALMTTHPPSQERIDLIHQLVKDENLHVDSPKINEEVYKEMTSVLPPKVEIGG